MANSKTRRRDDRIIARLALIMNQRLALTLIVLAHLAIAIPFGYGLNIWADEASSLYTTQNGVAAAFWGSLSDEKQAPLYFVLLSIWRYLDHSIQFARGLSIVFSVAAIVVFSGIARRIFRERFAIIATALFAIHPYLIWASAEIRLYSLVIVLTCLLTAIFFRGFFDAGSDGEITNSNFKFRALFAATAIVSLYTNYYLGSLLLGFFFVLLIYDRASARQYFYWMMGVGVAFVPMIVVVIGQLSGRVAVYSDPTSILEIARITWTNVLTFALPIEVYPGDEPSALSLIRSWLTRIALVIAAFVLIRDRSRKFEREIATFGIVAAFSAAFLVLVYFQIGLDQAGIRHASIYFVTVVLFVFAIADRLLPSLIKPAVVILLIASYGYTIAVMYPQYTKRGDWHRVANFVAENSTPDQPVVVFPVYETIAFSQNYRGPNQIIPKDRIFSFGYEGAHGSPGEYTGQIDHIIANILPDTDELWLLTSDKCEIGIACQPLETFVEANYNVVLDRAFYRERVRLIKKKK